MTKVNKSDVEMYRRFQREPLYFIETMFGLRVQKVRNEYQEEWEKEDCDLGKVRVYWFNKFHRGEEVTWQQAVMVRMIERAVNKKDSWRVAIASGRGTGKSSVMAIMIIWYLFCFKDAQIACTAPTTQQMHDVLWKEIQVWLNKLPRKIAEHFQWSNNYLRIAESPATWFARAMTARKENPDSLAGVHGEFVFCLADEAAGVPDQIFTIGEGSFTGKNKLFVMISNYRRTAGYFHEAFTTKSGQYQSVTLNSEHSPIVEPDFLATMLHKGKESDDYRVEVLGLPPKESSVDDKGFAPLLLEKDLHFTYDERLVGDLVMGVDPSGEGKNETIWVLRDCYKARILARESISNEKTISSKTILLAKEFGVNPQNVFVDAFGVGDKTIRELYMARFYAIGVNTTEIPDDKSKFFNKKAEVCWRLREWLRSGGELYGSMDSWHSILSLRYTIGEGGAYGKIKMMRKIEMKKLNLPSPDEAEALYLTFCNRVAENSISMENDDDPQDFDPFECV